MQKSLSVHASLSGTFLLAGCVPIYRLGFGAMRLTGPEIWGDPKDRSEAKGVLKRAIELGINLIDTADSYGPEVSENLIADALYPYPSGLVIATKGGLVRPGPHRWEPLGRPDYLIQCVEMSLRRLKKECLDLYQLHAVDPEVPIEKSLSALKKMQQEGKIRYIGLSNVSIDEIERARKIIDVVSIQNIYHLNERGSDEIIAYCEKEKLGFIPWYPLGSGDLARSAALQKMAKEKGATPAQIALAWLLKRSPNMLPIPGTSSIKHLEENVAAAALNLTESEFNAMCEFFPSGKTRK